MTTQKEAAAKIQHFLPKFCDSFLSYYNVFYASAKDFPRSMQAA